MIIESYVPNDRDGILYNIRKVAGPFTNEIQARRVAKAWSGSEDSDDIGSEQLQAGCSRRKITAKKLYEPEFVEPKKKMKKVTVEDKVYTNLTPIIQLPEPPELDIHYNVDKPYNVTHSGSDEENNNESLLEDVPSTSSAASSITPFKINNILPEEFSDNSDCGLEQNTNKNLFDFLTSATSDDFLEDNSITGDTENMSVLPLEKDLDNKSTSNVCCCEKIDILISSIEKRSNRDNQIMTQLMNLNGSNTRITAALQRLDDKVQKIMTADNRIRALATPTPKIPSPFFDLLPAKSVEDIAVVEELLTPTAENHALQYKEELKTFLYIKYGNLHLSAAIRGAIDACFYNNVLCHYSYRGKTKKKFVVLELYNVIREALSGLIKTASDETMFHKVVDNYLRHAK